ncbi:MAG TPA: HEAT repeat domain-containing protein [Acidobacteriota bacterium]|nr:HEAT repeat domain-containing protein [Acidobacteriota bacterium]
MSSTSRPITESSLNKDLNDIAHALIRELATACRKMAIYGPGHPLSIKALDKPFLVLGSIFRYKRYINLNVQKGCLYALNIGVKDTVFSAQILQYMQLLDIGALLFDRIVTPDEFAVFVENAVRRDSLYDPNFNVAACLSENGIASIQVNSEDAFGLFERGRQYRGEFEGDYSVRRFVLDQLGSDLVTLARAYAATDEQLLSMGIDFDADIVRYLIPERVASVDAGTIRAALTSLVDKINSVPSDQRQGDDAVNDYLTMFRLVEYHPDREQIVQNLDDSLVRNGARGHEPDPASATGTIKSESLSRVERLLDRFFAVDSRDYRVSDFADAFRRLMTTGQREKAEDVIVRLMDLMSSPEPDFRQKALSLLTTVFTTLNLVTDEPVMAFAVKNVAQRVRDRRETYEYSELVWKLFEKCLDNNRCAYLVDITTAMATRRQVEDDVTVYDSMAVKNAFEHINQRDVIDKLVSDLVKSRGEEATELKSTLVAICSEEVALTLASIMSHSERNVRQQALKILAELGKASLKVFTRILVNDSYFERDPGRHELADERWYVVRNSIFVLGSLGDPEGIMPLRLRLSDSDVRVRREIVRALEKIGSEEAVDCLIFIAEDPVTEIRESAIIAIGLIGTADTAPLLIDLVRRTRSDAFKCVTALGKLGGDEARAFLCNLLEDEKALTELAGGRVSREDLRVAVVRALGQIGDKTAIAKIQAFRARQSATQKMFFKNSSINKAIDEVLSRQ